MLDPQRLYWTTGRPPQLLTMAVTHVQTCAVSYHFQSSFVNLLDRSTTPYRAPRARKGSARPASPIPRPTHLLCTCGVCVTRLEQRPCCCARPSSAALRAAGAGEATPHMRTARHSTVQHAAFSRMILWCASCAHTASAGSNSARLMVPSSFTSHCA